MRQVLDLRLADGRRLRLHRTEGRADRTVVLCHPWPGSGDFDPDARQTSAREVTLLAPDRAGYGGSSPVAVDQWAGVERAADDLIEVLDELGLGPVGIAGWSAGGRVALAVAARRPELVDRLVLFATPAVDSLGLPPDVTELLSGLEAAAPSEAIQSLVPALERWAPGEDPLGPLDFLGGTEIDQERLAAVPGAAEELATMLRSAFAGGAAGFAADVAGTALRPWGFEADQVTAKTLLIYGNRDPLAANRHAQWWHSHLPTSRVEMAPGAGSLALLGLWKRALSHLTPRR